MDSARTAYESATKMNEMLIKDHNPNYEGHNEELCPLPLMAARVQETEKAFVALEHMFKDIRRQFVPHPIRRCPTELIELIFELCLDHDPCGSRYRDVVELSGVCYRWREIAVNLSSFWKIFPTALSWGHTHINSMWTEFSSRVRGNPVYITIAYDLDDDWSILEQLDFTKFANIEQISFTVNFDTPTNERSIQRLVQDTNLQLRLSGIRHLELDSGYKCQVDPSPMIDVLSTSGNLTMLSLSYFDFDSFSPEIHFERIEYLELLGGFNLMPHRLVSIFPNAQTVHITNKSFRRRTIYSGCIVWPKVHTLVVEREIWRNRQYYFPFYSFTMPKLKQVDFFVGGEHSYGVDGFLQRHTSVHTLLVDNFFLSFSPVTKGLPWLTSLTIVTCPLLGTVDWGKFTNLQSLTIYDERSEGNRKLSCWEFDRFVRLRCLAGYSGDQVDWIAPILTILVNEFFDSNEEARDWQRSIWIPAAHQGDYMDTGWKTYFAFTFQWR
jgi:hypothetical protein